MKKLQISLILIITSICGMSQEFDIDDEDLRNLLEIQGIHAFKYQFKLQKGEYISIEYDIYKYGEKINNRKVIEGFMKEVGIRFNHHHAKKDTTVYHRFYFYENSDSLEMHEYLPGFKGVQNIDISGVKEGDFKNIKHIASRLSQKRMILYYYSIYPNSKNYKESEGWLTCPTGKSLEELKNDYDFLIVFYADRISAKEAEELLGKGFYKNMSCPKPEK